MPWRRAVAYWPPRRPVRWCWFRIYHPLEVDVTAATAGDIQASKYRDEWQMVYVVNEQKTEAIENYLDLKRAAADKMRPGRSGD